MKGPLLGLGLGGNGGAAAGAAASATAAAAAAPSAAPLQQHHHHHQNGGSGGGDGGGGPADNGSGWSAWHHLGGAAAGAGPLTAEPEVTDAPLAGDCDEFVILGCDGLWDVFSSQRAVEFARARLRRHNDPRRCAEELVAEALRMHSSDNLTVVVVCLGPDAPPARVYASSALTAARGGAWRRASADGGGEGGGSGAASAGPSPGPSPVVRPLPTPARPPSPLDLAGGFG